MSDRKLTLYRDDSTVQVIYERVKAVFWTAGNTVLVISQFTDKSPGAHRYIHWPRERFCWFKDEPSPAESPGTMSDNARPIRCGDTVKHGPTCEEWLVAYVDGEHLAWCGWPPGEARLSDCTLVVSCSDEEHVSLLRKIAAVHVGAPADKRMRVAQRTLEQMGLPHE